MHDAGRSLADHLAKRRPGANIFATSLSENSQIYNGCKLLHRTGKINKATAARMLASAAVCVVMCVLASQACPTSCLTFNTTNYLTPSDVDLLAILPRPPQAGSAAQAADVKAVLSAQAQATPERMREAIADDQSSPERLADGVLGQNFKPERLPKTFALLARVAREGNALSELAKRTWGRPRPFAVDKRIRSLVGNPTNASYPSGHTTFAYEMAVLLGAMAPEKRDALFTRASRFAQSRVIAGVHFPSDLVAGQIAGTVVASQLMNARSFRLDFAEATKEFRQVIDTRPDPNRHDQMPIDRPKDQSLDHSSKKKV